MYTGSGGVTPVSGTTKSPAPVTLTGSALSPGSNLAFSLNRPDSGASYRMEIRIGSKNGTLLHQDSSNQTAASRSIPVNWNTIYSAYPASTSGALWIRISTYANDSGKYLEEKVYTPSLSFASADLNPVIEEGFIESCYISLPEGLSDKKFPENHIPTDTSASVYVKWLPSKVTLKNVASLKGFQVTWNGQKGGLSSSTSFQIPKAAPLLTLCDDGAAGINCYPEDHHVLTVKGNTKLTGSSSVHSASGTEGASGYVQIAEIRISGAYTDAPITMELCRRHTDRTCTLYIQFQSLETNDPPLKTFLFYGTDYQCYLSHSESSVWKLYVQKPVENDHIGVLRCHIPMYELDNILITWTNLQAENLPEGAVVASGNTVHYGAFHSYGNVSLNFPGSGYSTAYVSVPNAANSGASNYGLYHSGNYTSIPGATTSKSGLMGGADKLKLDRMKVGGIVGGTLVANPGGATSAKIVSLSTMNKTFGTSFTSISVGGRIHVLASNGDAAANPAHVEGVSYLYNDGYWCAVFDRSVQGAIRINWIAIYLTAIQ